MNIKFYSREKTYRFVVDLDEFRIIDKSTLQLTEVDHMTLTSKLWSDPTITISLEENGRVILAPKNVSKLIRKYGLLSINTYPMKINVNAFTLLEIISIYTYDSLSYEYWENNNHIFEIATGREVEFGSQRWDDIRNYYYYNTIKGVCIGQSMLAYLKSHGYPVSDAKPNMLFLSTKESDN